MANDTDITPEAARAVNTTARPDTAIMEIGRRIVAAEKRPASYDIGGLLRGTIHEGTANLRLVRAVDEKIPFTRFCQRSRQPGLW